VSTNVANQQFIDSLAARVQKKRPGREGVEERVRSLAPLALTSTADIVRVLPTLSGDHLYAAIEVCGILELRMAGPILLPFMESPDEGLRWYAQSALSDMASRRTYRPLAKIAVTHADVEVQYQACYTISWTHDEAAAPILLELYYRPDLPPRVRGEAAEGLANTLGYSDRRKSIFKQAAAPLIQGLRDESAEVRFWSAFALGQMHARQAIPELERVAAEDTGFCPGWWYVREEASDALGHIRGVDVPGRDCLGWTETGEPRVPEQI
jgi:hypothetical protein